VAVGSAIVVVDSASTGVGRCAVGDALLAGSAVSLLGAGVLVTAALHAVKITPNPIALLNPRILKTFLRLIPFLPDSKACHEF
jgi:hypothetical protein